MRQIGALAIFRDVHGHARANGGPEQFHRRGAGIGAALTRRKVERQFVAADFRRDAKPFTCLIVIRLISQAFG